MRQQAVPRCQPEQVVRCVQRNREDFVRSDRQRNRIGIGDLKALTRILNLRIEKDERYARNGGYVVALRLNAIDELPGLLIGPAFAVAIGFKKIETLGERR